MFGVTYYSSFSDIFVIWSVPFLLHVYRYLERKRNILSVQYELPLKTVQKSFLNIQVKPVAWSELRYM